MHCSLDLSLHFSISLNFITAMYPWIISLHCTVSLDCITALHCFTEMYHCTVSMKCITALYPWIVLYTALYDWIVSSLLSHVGGATQEPPTHFTLHAAHFTLQAAHYSLHAAHCSILTTHHMISSASNNFTPYSLWIFNKIWICLIARGQNTSQAREHCSLENVGSSGKHFCV